MQAYLQPLQFLEAPLFLLVLGTSAPGACLLGGEADPAGWRPVRGQQGRWVYSGPRRREAIFVVGAEWLASGQERVLAGALPTEAVSATASRKHLRARSSNARSLNLR